MILSDWDIRVYLEKKLLVINPLFDDTVRENGVDLRFGYRFCRFRGGEVVVDTRVMNVPDVLECIDVDKENGFLIKPYEHVLATTLEWIELPYD
ncbi:MAG: dCTP deaminase, partial [Desulfurococcaceae archaeon]